MHFCRTVSAILRHSYQSSSEGRIIIRYSLKSRSSSPCWTVTLTKKLNRMKTDYDTKVNMSVAWVARILLVSGCQVSLFVELFYVQLLYR